MTAPSSAGPEREAVEARTRLVRQEDAWGCGVAALAMVTGETYAEVSTWILDNWVHAVMGRESADDWLAEHGVTQYALDWYLGEHGFAWRRLYRAWTAADSWPPAPFAPVHVAQVVQPSGNAHFVVVTSDGRVLDPMTDTPRSLTDWEKVNFVQGCWSLAALAAAVDEARREGAETALREAAAEFVRDCDPSCGFDCEEAARWLRSRADALRAATEADQ